MEEGSKSIAPSGPSKRRLARSALTALAVLGLLGAALASSLTLAPAGAAVTDSPESTPPPGFELPGTDGYSVEVSGVAPQGGSSAEVVVRVAAGRGSVTYRFPGVVEEGSMHADLGHYGRISVAFHPASGGTGASEVGCSRSLSSASGYYEGTIAFRAEGLTAVDATRAKGSVGLALSLLCATELEKDRLRQPGTYLEVSGGPAAPSLAVLQPRSGVAAQIEAAISERRGGVEIERSVSVGASSSSFRHRRLRSATISPPKPFSGSATFRREGTHGDWRGNLRVDFPGRRHVALAGKSLRASLRRGRSG